MIKIYGRPDSSAVARVMWTIGELGLEYERVDWGGKFGGNDDPDYRAIQPAGKIPAVTFEDGASLWESNAVIRYLCDVHGRGCFLPEGRIERAHMEAWMDWSGSFAGAVSRIRKAYKPASATQAEIDGVIEAVRPLIDILNSRLDGREFVLGGDITAADFALGVWAHRLWRCPDSAKPDGLGPIWRWLERLQERPAYQRHVMDKVSAGPQTVGGG